MSAQEELRTLVLEMDYVMEKAVNANVIQTGKEMNTAQNAPQGG